MVSWLVNNQTGVKIGVMDMSPARKKPCLVVIRGNKAIKYASFNNDMAADEFLDILTGFIGANSED